MFLVYVLCTWTDQSKFMTGFMVFFISGLVQVSLSLVVKIVIFQLPFSCYYPGMRSVLRYIS